MVPPRRGGGGCTQSFVARLCRHILYKSFASWKWLYVKRGKDTVSPNQILSRVGVGVGGRGVCSLSCLQIHIHDIFENFENFRKRTFDLRRDAVKRFLQSPGHIVARKRGYKSKIFDVRRIFQRSLFNDARVSKKWQWVATFCSI